MIKKIIQIKNLGKFLSPSFGKNHWTGVFEQTNVIYANNGCGKTTFSLMYRSLKGNNELIIKKKSFSSSENPEIILLDEQNREIKFKKGVWNKNKTNIQIFDSFFIDDNVYMITLKEKISKENIFELLLGEESIKIRKEINGIIEEIAKLKNKKRNLRSNKKHALTEEAKREILSKLEKYKTLSNDARDKIVELEERSLKLSAENRDEYLKRINEYLTMFNPNLKLTSLLPKNRSKILYALEVSGYTVRTDDESLFSLKYSLSEGDKNALALSFFLSKIDMIPNLNEYTIIIDDPITSFDYSRKNTTINNLINLSKRVKKFILLTHDLIFANEFSRKLNYTCNNLKIDFDGTTSYFIKHDIEKEALTGVFKDLTVLHEYLAKGVANDFERRDTMRCIRPVLEGIFRVKFFREIQRTEWLGDIILKIRNSQPDSLFYNHRSLLDTLVEINDYSKEYHHSNPYNIETPINDAELRNYVNRTIELLYKI